MYPQLIHHIDSTLSNQKRASCNDIHSCYLLCLQLLNDMVPENALLDILKMLESKEKINLKTDFMCHSVLIDVLVKLVQLLHGAIRVVELLVLHFKLSLSRLIDNMACIVGQPYMEKSLARAFVVLLDEEKGEICYL